MKTKWVALIAAGLFVASCQTEPEIPERGPATPLDPAVLGTISGTVWFDGEPPPPGTIRVSGDPNCKPQDLEEAADVQVADGRLANSFVYIKDGLGDMVFERPTEVVEIDQLGCLYRPHVAGVQTGQPLRFRNSDPTLHNVHTQAKNSRSVNFGMPVQNDTRDIRLAKPEIMVPVKCDVHPWMKVYIGVLDHSYFAVTGADGTFELGGVPPGEFVIEAWHERFGTRTVTVTLEPSKAAAAELRFSPG